MRIILYQFLGPHIRCPGIGCNKMFQSRGGLHKHKKKCQFPLPVQESKYHYRKEPGQYVYRKRKSLASVLETIHRFMSMRPSLSMGCAYTNISFMRPNNKYKLFHKYTFVSYMLYIILFEISIKRNWIYLLMTTINTLLHFSQFIVFFLFLCLLMYLGFGNNLIKY